MEGERGVEREEKREKGRERVRGGRDGVSGGGRRKGRAYKSMKE